MIVVINEIKFIFNANISVKLNYGSLLNFTQNNNFFSTIDRNIKIIDVFLKITLLSNFKDIYRNMFCKLLGNSSGSEYLYFFFKLQYAYNIDMTDGTTL